MKFDLNSILGIEPEQTEPEQTEPEQTKSALVYEGGRLIYRPKPPSQGEPNVHDERHAAFRAFEHAEAYAHQLRDASSTRSNPPNNE